MTTEYLFNFGFTPALDGHINMEIDRHLGEVEPVSLPTVRLYTWNRPTISCGLNQNPLKRLLIEKCLEDGIEIVARPTGGREILHGWDLCCSVIMPVDQTSSGLKSSRFFDDVNAVLMDGLNRMGIRKARYHTVSSKAGFNNGPCFSQIDRGEISVSGRKLIASAQRVYDKTVLQQSSISLRKPSLDILDYLRDKGKTAKEDLIVNSGAYLEDVLHETFSLSGIVEEIKGAFEMALGKSDELKIPEIFSYI